MPGSQTESAESAERIVIIGGGLMGCTLALELAQLGVEVEVLERAVPGAEASSAAAGILGPRMEAHGREPFRRLALASLDLYPAWCAKITAMSGLPTGLWRSGLWRLVLAGEDAAACRPDPAAIWRADLPAPFAHAAGAWELPDEGSVNPPLLVAAVRAAAEQAGARFLSGIPVTDIAPGQVRLADGRAVCGTVVLCAGAWSGQLPGLERLARLPVRPVRGQVIALQAAPGLLDRVLFCQGGYLVPRPDGRIIVGATVEEVGFARAVTAGGIAALLDAATSALPALAAATFLQAWCNFRPATHDGEPLIGWIGGASPETGVFVVSGHYRNGILLAPITGRIAAAALLSGEPPPPEWDTARLG